MHRMLRGGFRAYTVMLCVFYLFIVFLFHSSLQPQQPRGISDHAHEEEEKPVFPPPPTSSHEDKLFLPPDKPLKPVHHGGDIDPSPPQNEDVMNKHGDSMKAKDKVGEIGDNGVVNMDQKKVVLAPPAEQMKAREHPLLTKVSPPLPCTGPDIEDQSKFQAVAPDVLIYSVYWDERPNDFDNLSLGYYIRMMAVINSRAAHMQRAVYCIFLHGDTEIAVQALYYEMCENHNRPYGGYILSCPVPAKIKQPPCSILLSQSTDDTKAERFKVQSTVAREQRRDFAVCVSPLFGDIDMMKLVEWIEMTQYLGAKHINFYHYDYKIADPSLRRILQYYIDGGIVSVHDWALEEHIDKNMWYHGQLVAVQDCLYRNMATAQYVMFNDLDEFMVPHVHSNWTTFISALDDKETCGFQFHSAFFDPARQEPEKTSLEYTNFFTLTDIKRSVTTSRVRTKCLIKADKVFEAGIHHISKPIYANLHGQRIDQPVAFLHHYRTCMPNYRMDCSKFQDDPILPERYGASVVASVKGVLRSLRKELIKYTMDSGFKHLLQAL